MYTRRINLTITLLSLAIILQTSTASACRNDSAVKRTGGNIHQESALAGQLRTQLEEKGWTAVSTEDGSTYYLPPQAKKTEPPIARHTQSLAEQLGKELKANGWVATTAEDGSVYYLPPGTRYRVSPTPPKPSSLAAQLREQLENSGWTSVLTGDGSVVYLPPQAETSPRPIPALPDSSRSEQPLPPRNEAVDAGVDTPTIQESSPVATTPAGTSETGTKKPEAEVAQGSGDESPGVGRDEQAVTEEAKDTTEPTYAVPPAPAYRRPPPYPYGWAPYPGPAYPVPYPAPPAWQSPYRPAPPWHGYPR